MVGRKRGEARGAAAAPADGKMGSWRLVGEVGRRRSRGAGEILGPAAAPGALGIKWEFGFVGMGELGVGLFLWGIGDFYGNGGVR